MSDDDGVRSETPVGLRDFATEVFDVIRDIRDPEKPETLEELAVLTDGCVRVNYFGKENVESEDALSIIVEFTPTVPHCSLATLIGLCVRVKITRVFGRRHKLRILLAPGSHQQEGDVNKQINDKERVAAAMENRSLKDLVERCIGEEE